MASIVATIDAMKEEGMVEHAAQMGELLGAGLRALADKHALIGEVRGMGVFWALELVSNRASRAKLPAAAMNTIKAACMARGLLPFIADNRIHVVPPCNVSAEEVARALAIYDDVLAEVAVEYTE